MGMLDIIATKRDGGELTATEIEFLIRGYVANEIPDYQVAAFLMAVYIRGLSEAETVALTHGHGQIR
jgi:pyrimidine-nucleoside phosphorylase